MKVVERYKAIYYPNPNCTLKLLNAKKSIYLSIYLSIH